jgi:hypothetical protein
MKMRSKKGMEMSMNVIITAVLVLIVLIVLILIFTGQLGKTRGVLNSTSSTYSGDKCNLPGMGRSCKYSWQCEDKGGIDYGKLDCTAGMICCSE